jgi:hypothetical protein
VNKDVLPNKTQPDPITGYMDAILISGDFCEAYNLLAIISSNPKKPSPIHYLIGKESGNLILFAALTLCNSFLVVGSSMSMCLSWITLQFIQEVMQVTFKIICGTQWLMGLTFS